MPRDPPVHDSSGIVKTRDFGHFAPFSWSSQQLLRPRRISMPRDPQYITLVASSKLMISGIFGRFRGL